MLRYAEKKVKLTNWRHPYFSHFCWMVWGAGKFVVKTARVYRVKTDPVNTLTGIGNIIILYMPDCHCIITLSIASMKLLLKYATTK